MPHIRVYMCIHLTNTPFEQSCVLLHIIFMGEILVYPAATIEAVANVTFRSDFIALVVTPMAAVLASVLDALQGILQPI